MIEAALISYQFNASMERRLVADLNDQQMVQQPALMSNQPAWTLGHLALASDFAAAELGMVREFDAAWEKQFGQGSQPTSERAAYPAKDPLLSLYDHQHQRVSDALIKCAQQDLQAPTSNVNAREIFPTKWDYLVFLMATHEATHLGQMIIWRRLCGFSRVSNSA